MKCINRTVAKNNQSTSSLGYMAVIPQSISRHTHVQCTVHVPHCIRVQPVTVEEYYVCMHRHCIYLGTIQQ